MILQNKIALITGATGVIGKAIAQHFAKEGAILLLSGRSRDKLEELRKEFGSVEVCQADVSQKSDVVKLVETASKKFGRLDILVAAAGTYGAIGSIENSEPKEWLKAIQVNLLGTMMSVRYALPLLKKSERGKIITFAGGGEGALPNFTSYIVSKAGILRLTETLAQELKQDKIDINAISPGAVNSGLNQEMLKAGKNKAGEEMYQKALEQIEQGGVSPDKAAELAVWLASDASNGLSGRNISALWDNWRDIPKHLDEIMQSDIYTSRRIKPKDRGYDWK